MHCVVFQAPVIKSNELLYFADVCAGPGGFSEYVLWRKKWSSKGFGFTLKGANDFQLGNFHAAPSELFEPHYGRKIKVKTMKCNLSLFKRCPPI